MEKTPGSFKLTVFWNSDRHTDPHAHYCGQSYKAFTIVINDSRVVPDLKISHITTLES